MERAGTKRRATVGAGDDSAREATRDPPARSRARLDRRRIAFGAAALATAEPAFAAILAERGEPPLWRRPESFRTFVHIVLEQKVSIASARAVMERVDALCPGVDPTAFLALPERALREAGVSARKVGYCRAIARAIADGELALAALRRLDDDAVIERLVAVRGIGPWTAGVYLTMALARADAWPTGDRALAVGVAERFAFDAVPGYAALDRMAERWRPWRGVAARLIWHDYLGRRGR